MYEEWNKKAIESRDNFKKIVRKADLAVFCTASLGALLLVAGGLQVLLGASGPWVVDYRRSNVYYHRETEGRMSSMEKRAQKRADLLQGTLDMLVLRTLLYGPAHGHQIGKHIQRTTNDFLQMQHGSLYPALHRLERKGWVVSKWEVAADRNREFNYYRLTERGKKQLALEESKWSHMVDAVARVMSPVTQES